VLELILCSKNVIFGSGSVSNRLHTSANRLHCEKLAFCASGSASNRLHTGANRLHLTENYSFIVSTITWVLQLETKPGRKRWKGLLMIFMNMLRYNAFNW